MKRPSFQFYPGDWSSNPNLRRCTFAERGIWVEVMCLMHDQDEYGILRWPLKEIAGAVGCKVSDLQALMRKGVMKGDDKRLDDPFIYVPRSGRKDGEPVTLIDTQDGPIWYSSRMVKDEYVRTIRGESSANNATSKQPPNNAPKGGFGEGFGPRGSSSSSPPSDNPIVTESGISTPSTAAGEVCARLKSSGIPNVNPQHPKLIALLDAGLTVDEIAAVGPEAKEKGKGFPWILATAEGRRRDAAQVGSLPAAQAKPWFVSGSGITTKGEELGLFERDFETFPAFKAAVFKQAGVTDDMVRRAQQDGH